MSSGVAAVEALLSSADAEQVRMMEEQVILTDYFDNCIGAGSKKDTHIWTSIQNGMLHRAFSVFLFTPDGRLILQQRSGAKITFPYIWANTCCSHPLHVPSEMETKDAMGVKNAARRKLEHELGIPPEDVPLESFTWLTRVHYVGASIPKDGSEPLWGEHEIDWILMCKPARMPRININTNEIEQIKMFTQPELRAWMSTLHTRGEEVSPWFGVMEKSLLYRWWDAVLANNFEPVIQREIIHRAHDLEALATRSVAVTMPVAFEACLRDTQKRIADSIAAEDRGANGAGADGEATAIPGATAAVPKQGAYGKVPIHSESKLAQLSHLDEVWTALTYKLGFSDITKVKPLAPNTFPAYKFCERMLMKTSRSFAMVIQQLPDHLRFSVCVFYLVLRGLDTVEDDMTAFIGRQGEKLTHLRSFHRYLYNPRFRLTGVGEGDEATLLRYFFNVNMAFSSLPRVDQIVIEDICARMGEGMASYCGRDLREGTNDVNDYNLYCHYVAGLVGEGLSRLFVAHGDEEPIVAQDVKLADDMGLFLQKTNIIRDYLEDLVDGRAFWPREIWAQYSPGLSNLRHKVSTSVARVSTPRNSSASSSTSGSDFGSVHDDITWQEEQARACLNHLIADAMTLAPSCLEYLSRLRTKDVFRFCAIPQVMAISTLDKLTNNPDVFTGVVKIRKGQALRLISQANDMHNVYCVFLHHARSILAKIPPSHKTAYEIAFDAVRRVEAICLANLPPSNAFITTLFSPYVTVGVIILFVAMLRHLYIQSKLAGWGHGHSYLPRITDSWDVAALAACCACVLYLLSVAGVPLAMRLGAGNANGDLAEGESMEVSSSMNNVGAGVGFRKTVDAMAGFQEAASVLNEMDGMSNHSMSTSAVPTKGDNEHRGSSPTMRRRIRD